MLYKCSHHNTIRNATVNMCVFEMFYPTEVAQSEQKPIAQTDCSKVTLTA